MEALWAAITIAVSVLMVGAWAVVIGRVWLTPVKLERRLRRQGLQGTPYALLIGDSNQIFKMRKEASSKPMNLSHDIAPRTSPFILQVVNKYGKNPFMWLGPVPRIILTDPELIKDVMNKVYDFPKPKSNPIIRLIASGLADYDGEKWAKHRRLINPAFTTEKLKIMLPTFFETCNYMVNEWEKMLSSEGSYEMDVCPFLQNLTCDVISRTAFGSSYEEGKRIFQLLKEQPEFAMKVLIKSTIPGWRFLSTATHRRMKKIDKDIRDSLKGIINKREKAMKEGEVTKDDLLGILLESNQKEIQQHGNKNVGLTIQEIMEECKLFYIAGQETTYVLLVWTMVLLSMYPDWQKHAREEVFQVFGNQTPGIDGLGHLKIMTMILYEVLRLYPPVLEISRSVHRDMELGKLTIPSGVHLSLPIILIHHDPELWGDDAKEFKPERFSEGIFKATKGQVSFFPFGWGPRICIGQNFSLLEAKIALSLILQRFTFELSPTYAHAPASAVTLKPQHGAQIILHKL